MTALGIAGLVLCGVGALLHGYIFWLESFVWTGTRARRIFGFGAEDARVTAPLALNQGFYNLFLGIEVAIGIVLVAAGLIPAGVTAVFIGAGSMVAAAAVLLISSPDKARPALVQGTAPLLGVLLLAIGLLTA